jgi:hypothetical protein
LSCPSARGELALRPSLLLRAIGDGMSSPESMRKMSDDRQYAPHRYAIAISFSMSFAMSCQRRASSLKSQEAQASTSFILREIFRLSFSNLPILNRTPAECRRLGNTKGHSD